MTEPRLGVEVAYATAEEQVILRVQCPHGTTVEQAVRRSGILDRFAEIDLAENKVGVFGKAVRLDAVLSEGDRVEIYRPLIADPKAARKKRAAQGKAMKKGAREEASGDD